MKKHRTSQHVSSENSFHLLVATMFYAILSFCVLSGALAQSPGLGRCPSVKTIESFDISSYMGRWFEVERYFSAFEVASKCNTADYVLGENGTIQMVNTKYTLFTGKPLSFEFSARVPDIAEPGKLKVKFSSDPIGVETDYLILGTDYKNYAIVYNCINVGVAHMKHAWILTRERHPPRSVVDEAFEIAEHSQLQKNKFTQTIQTGC